MLRRLATLIQLDSTVTVRNRFHLVILGLAVLMILLINFVFPAELKLTPTEFFADATPGQVFTRILQENGIDKRRIYASPEELREAVGEEPNSIGIIMKGTPEQAKFTVIHQGKESAEVLNLLDASLEATLDAIRDRERQTNHRVEYLREKVEPVPFNKKMLPVLLVLEVVMLGFLLVAVMVFQEKEEGGVRAYRVSPGGTLEYIFSKAFVNVVLAVIYGLVLTGFTMGFGVNYPALLSVIVLASLLMTLLGLAISVFFRSLQEFLFVGVGVMALMGVPLVSYLMPAFTPSFITWLPSYPVLFGIREVLFSTGKEAFVASLNWNLLIECLILLVFALWAVQKKLMREGK